MNRTLTTKELQKKIRALPKYELLLQARALVTEERRIQAEFLVYLERIEAIGLHLEMAYGSLHEFMTRELGFSEGAAQRRIQALFLMKAIPETKNAIESGELSLSVASTLQTFFRTEARVQDKHYRPEEKRELFNAVQGLSRRDAEKVLSKVSPQSMLPPEKLRPITETQYQLTIVVDSKVGKQLERLLGLLAHHRPAPRNYGELVAFLARMGIEKHDPLEKAEAKARAAVKVKADTMLKPGAELKAGAEFKVKEREDDQDEVVRTAAPPAGSSKCKSNTSAKLSSNGNQRYLSAGLERALWSRDQGRCTWSSPSTGQRCQSRHALEADHCTPFAQGGKTVIENLRLLCKAHHRHVTLQAFGSQKMQQYWRT